MSIVDASADTCRGFQFARDVEIRVGPWLVWFGRTTRKYWAMSLRDPKPSLLEDRLIEADSAAELLRRLLTVTTVK